MTIALIGVGLIGGSIGLTARARLHATVDGYDPDPEALGLALERGAIDRGCSSIEAALAHAECCFVAAPVGSLNSVIDEALAAASPDCVVSDVGSIKHLIMRGRRDPRFVGGHPLAGAETAGVRNARADLFQGATWYLTPGQNASGMLYERLHRTVVALGAQPTAIDPDAHDHLMASISHLPHVLANVLVAQAGDALARADRLPAVAPSFRDAARVAGANSAIWTDIYIANRDALIDRVDEVQRRLGQVRELLAVGDPAAISDWNDAAGHARRRLLEAQFDGSVVHELRVAVPNRPGVVARLALELGRAGINIADMALYPAADMSEGVVALWVAGEGAARRAGDLVERLGYPVARL